jgi:hypothetical protein
MVAHAAHGAASSEVTPIATQRVASAAVVIGESLGTALRTLQRPGLAIIYSSALVPPNLKVTVLPSAPEAADQAREILAPHSLSLHPVAPGLYAVVRANLPQPSPDIAPTLSRVERPLPRDSDPPPISDVVVQGTREAGEGPDVATAQLLDRAQISAQPGLRDDAFRSAARVPGVTLNGLSAAPHVRGGGEDEVLALLDGFPIRQPYHLSGYQNVFSVIDPQLISSMEVFTGGFPARFGGRMSGVFDMRLPDQYGRSTRGLGMSFFNASARGSDVIAGVDGWDWLGMGRVGTLGVVLDALAPGVAEPSYGDFVGRLRWLSSADSEIALYVLGARDSLDIDNQDHTEHARLDSHSLYTWLRSEQHWEDGSQLTVWLGNTSLTSSRAGQSNDPLISFGRLYDSRDTSIWDLRARYAMPLGLTQELQIGGEWSVGSASYDYDSHVEFTPEIAALFGKPQTLSDQFIETPEVHELHFFASHRWDITPTVTTEMGFRLERDSGFGLDAHTMLDPRLALKWAFLPDTQMRVQWGRFHQSDEVNELRVQEGMTVFDRPQRSDHLIFGLDHRLQNGVALRAEAFSKRQLDPRVRYENLFDRLAILPELEPDHVRVAPDSSELRGLELSAERRGHPFSWWASYTWAQALDDIDSVELPRSWDQRHAVTLGTSYQRGRWDASVVGTAHSGWPITDLITTPTGAVLGTRSGDRVPTYFSVDMRVRYHWFLERSDLAVAFELTNALDRNNSCCRELTAHSNPDGTTSFGTRQVDSLPLIPSLSVQWSR